MRDRRLCACNRRLVVPGHSPCAANASRCTACCRAVAPRGTRSSRSRRNQLVPASFHLRSGIGHLEPEVVRLGPSGRRSAGAAAVVDRELDLPLHRLRAAQSLAASGGPNIISDGHHQRSSASCAIAFCSGITAASASRCRSPWRWWNDSPLQMRTIARAYGPYCSVQRDHSS